MCGIIGYVGKREAFPIIVKGLQRLEYRGYDSTGVALLNGDLHIYKCKGKVNDMVSFSQGKDLSGNIGIGHTRWATHGVPNDINAHPHLSASGNLAIIHNGIIENYAVIKEALIERGHTFASDTDTEVLIHLIEDIQQADNLALEEAVRLALQQVVGAYAIVIIARNDPHRLVAARKSSPLVIGIGTDEFFIASDATPIVEHTKNVVYLKDEEIAVVDNTQNLSIKNLHNQHKTPFVEALEWNLETLEKAAMNILCSKKYTNNPTRSKIVCAADYAPTRESSFWVAYATTNKNSSKPNELLS